MPDVGGVARGRPQRCLAGRGEPASSTPLLETADAGRPASCAAADRQAPDGSGHRTTPPPASTVGRSPKSADAAGAGATRQSGAPSVKPLLPARSDPAGGTAAWQTLTPCFSGPSSRSFWLAERRSLLLDARRYPAEPLYKLLPLLGSGCADPRPPVAESVDDRCRCGALAVGTGASKAWRSDHAPLGCPGSRRT